jgi:hypothetical protein
MNIGEPQRIIEILPIDVPMETPEPTPRPAVPVPVPA